MKIKSNVYAFVGGTVVSAGVTATLFFTPNILAENEPQEEKVPQRYLLVASETEVDTTNDKALVTGKTYSTTSLTSNTDNDTFECGSKPNGMGMGGRTDDSRYDNTIKGAKVILTSTNDSKPGRIPTLVYVVSNTAMAAATRLTAWGTYSADTTTCTVKIENTTETFKKYFADCSTCAK